MYAASKWALEGFAEGLAMELAPFGVSVVVIEPGNYRTPFGSKVQVIKPAGTAYSAAWQDLIPGITRLGSIGADPEDATAAFIAALTDPKPSFMTRVGLDADLFSRWKREYSFEARAAAVRRIVGFPQVLGSSAGPAPKPR